MLKSILKNTINSNLNHSKHILRTFSSGSSFDLQDFLIKKSNNYDVHMYNLIQHDIMNLHYNMEELNINETKLHREIAYDVFQWAVNNGAEYFAHWFAPMRYTTLGSGSALKYTAINSVFSHEANIFKPELIFSGETDGSSFPNGGLRETNESAGFTIWDFSSNPFICNGVLYLPSLFLSHYGESLDNKTPLLRSEVNLSNQSVRLLNLINKELNIKNDKLKYVQSELGWEQEFFLIDRATYQKRPDLLHSGRTLMGSDPHYGQQTSAHFFNVLPSRVGKYLKNLQNSLIQIGIPVNVFHNEVAPSQHEISPNYQPSNFSSDANLFTMEMMHGMAGKHNLVALLHEKPFNNLNGSGKHANWGIRTNDGHNIFKCGDSKESQVIFITFIAALCHAFHKHSDLIRIGTATPGNDHRLGQSEAPPGIMSIYLGDELTKKVEDIINGGELFGYASIGRSLPSQYHLSPKIKTRQEDRNRTAPFPFCGNRFEFRAVGSSQHTAFPLALLNVAVTDGIDYLSSEVEKGRPIKDVVKEIFTDTKDIIFNGDGYSNEWIDEAKKRNLPNYKTAFSSISTLSDDKNIQLLKKYEIFTERETYARQNTLYDRISNTLDIEAKALTQMITRGVLPSLIRDNHSYDMASNKLNSDQYRDHIQKRSNLTDQLINKVNHLEKTLKNVPETDDHHDIAKYYEDNIKTLMNETREIVDECENIIYSKEYPFPTYDNMLYDHHSEF